MAKCAINTSQSAELQDFIEYFLSFDDPISFTACVCFPAIETKDECSNANRLKVLRMALCHAFPTENLKS